MHKDKVELSVLNPRGKIAGTPRIIASPRLNTLTGKKIGVLKFGVWGITEKIWPGVKEELKKRVSNIQFREWSFTGSPVSREERQKEIVEYSDGIILMLGMTGTSSARTAVEAVELERMGKPVAFAVTKPFQTNARLVAGREGLPDISLVVVPLDALPHPGEIEELQIADKFADDVVKALTQTPQIEAKEPAKESLSFRGENYSKAVSNVEKFFIQNGWSDGYPFVAVQGRVVGITLLPQEFPGTVPRSHRSFLPSWGPRMSSFLVPTHAGHVGALSTA